MPIIRWATRSSDHEKGSCYALNARTTRCYTSLSTAFMICGSIFRLTAYAFLYQAIWSNPPFPNRGKACFQVSFPLRQGQFRSNRILEYRKRAPLQSPPSARRWTCCGSAQPTLASSPRTRTLFDLPGHQVRVVGERSVLEGDWAVV